MSARQPELIGKTFTDEDGHKYEGWRYLTKYTNNPEYPTGMIITDVQYRNGKVHGNPAIVYQDGQEEQWDNGQFVKILELPFCERS